MELNGIIEKKITGGQFECSCCGTTDFHVRCYTENYDSFIVALECETFGCHAVTKLIFSISEFEELSFYDECPY